jgi:hypothetical protein
MRSKSKMAVARTSVDQGGGLQWRKLDLHAHTPASLDFHPRDLSPAEFVAAAVANGLDAVGITDHNTGEWIDAVREAAIGHLAVYPGVEITATGGEGGIHIIALFGPESTTRTVENLLGALDIRAEKYGKPEALAPHSPQDVIAAIGEHGGLAVLAHADSSNGLIKEMKGQARIDTVRHRHLAGIEIVGNFAKHQGIFDGTDPNYRRRLCVYRASDNPTPDGGGGHSADGLGSRFSWFKIDEFSLEALRQCFGDPSVRVRADVVSSQMPHETAPRIISLSASQGFLSERPVEFHRGLNSIIGGKGVGKSLVVEFLRFALGQPSSIPDVNADMREKLRTQLGAGGVVTAVLELATGETLTVQRTFDEDTDPIAVIRDDGSALDADVRSLFPILAYSQTEAVEIAKDESSQLKLIDSFVDLGDRLRQMDGVRAKLRKLDGEFSDALLAGVASTRSGDAYPLCRRRSVNSARRLSRLVSTRSRDTSARPSTYRTSLCQSRNSFPAWSNWALSLTKSRFPVSQKN